MAQNVGSGGGVPSASELRMKLVEKEMAALEKSRQARLREEEDRAKITEEFLKGHVTEGERMKIRKLVMNAVEQGQLEAMVYSFPSSMCSDGGRAINNGELDWPKTLQGKARELYERYQEVAKPQGYKLKAMIIDFPGGMPGDVGFFLNWGK
jgi:hypothetical protein